MKHSYSCPNCTATLNPNIKIVLTSVCSGHRGLLLLSPQPGNYEVIFSEELKFANGAAVDLYCPVCAESLQSKIDPKLARIDFRTEEGEEGHVCFSRTVGEHATWFITSDEVSAFGDDVDSFNGLNFFGAGTVSDL